MISLIVFLVFLLGAGSVLGAYSALSSVPGILAKRRLDRRLHDVSAPAGSESDGVESLIKRKLSGPIPFVDKLVSRSSAGSWLSTLIEQAGLRTTPSAVVLMTVASAGLAWLITRMFTPVWFLALAAAAVGATIPLGVIMYKRSARMRAFEEHFPEALDLLSRALQAGHAFQTAMGMVADELKPPVGPEFRKTFEQQNFGLPLRDALDQLAERVPILDVRFFVTAVLIQRETGGNLAEILDNLAHVVRERFKIRRQVRVHTAHGRFTAFVLLSLPPALAIALMFLNPDHMNLLFNDKMGQQMLIGAIVMQTIGFIWIRKIIKIEV
jgi:tight adherence protein B